MCFHGAGVTNHHAAQKSLRDPLFSGRRSSRSQSPRDAFAGGRERRRPEVHRDGVSRAKYLEMTRAGVRADLGEERPLGGRVEGAESGDRGAGGGART